MIIFPLHLEAEAVSPFFRDTVPIIKEALPNDVEYVSNAFPVALVS